MLAFAFEKNPDIMKLLPDKQDIHLLPRQYIANVIYYSIGRPFKVWVDLKIKERKDNISKLGNGGIQMDAETYARFQAWEQISSKCSQVANIVCNSHQRERRPPHVLGNEAEAHQGAVGRAAGA